MPIDSEDYIPVEDYFEAISTFYRSGDLRQMTIVTKQAIEDYPKNAELKMLMGVARGEAGFTEEAIHWTQESIDLNEKSFQAHFNQAAYLLRLGHVEQARENLVRVVQLQPKFGRGWAALLDTQKVNPGNPIIGRMRGVYDRKGLSDDSKSHIAFALAKAYDDIGEQDLSFRFLKTANDLYPIEPMKPSDLTINLISTKEVWSKDLADQIKSECQTDAPIFIVGMPRSGTTLVEQILDRHHSVKGMGELGYINQIVDFSESDLGCDYPFNLTEAQPEHLLKYADSYMSHITLSEGQTRFVDKHPLNFRHVGLIKSMFPNSVIINMVRDPLDVILSCYQQPFASGQAFSFNLEHCGLFYSYYEAMMKHWRQVFPQSIIDVDYDHLVSHPRVGISALLSDLGLSQDEACFEHHKFQGTINTASVMQANQAINNKSSGRSLAYRKYLVPVLGVLEK